MAPEEYSVDLSDRGLTECTIDDPNIQRLYLSSNRLSDFPISITHNMTCLTWLDLRSNKIKLIPPEISNLSSLKVLLLQDNFILLIPPEIVSLTTLEVLNVNGNPIEDPPLQVVRRGLQEIRQYLREKYSWVVRGDSGFHSDGVDLSNNSRPSSVILGTGSTGGPSESQYFADDEAGVARDRQDSLSDVATMSEDTPIGPSGDIRTEGTGIDDGAEVVNTPTSNQQDKSKRGPTWARVPLRLPVISACSLSSCSPPGKVPGGREMPVGRKIRSRKISVDTRSQQPSVRLMRNILKQMERERRQLHNNRTNQELQKVKTTEFLRKWRDLYRSQSSLYRPSIKYSQDIRRQYQNLGFDVSSRKMVNRQTLIKEKDESLSPRKYEKYLRFSGREDVISYDLSSQERITSEIDDVISRLSRLGLEQGNLSPTEALKQTADTLKEISDLKCKLGLM